VILLVADLVVLAVILFFALRSCEEEKKNDLPSPAEVQEPAGERFAYSAFYHADDGAWRLCDENLLVLKEQKFITESERDAYLVHEITPADVVRILEAQQRWKRVEILRDGKVIATGWLDANFTHDVERLDPQSQKAMKQQYPH
jgi:hypothetical protein